MLDIIRYVASTAEHGLTYGRSKVPIQIWCDANFAACTDTRCNVSGWVVVCFGGAISWASCKQPTTATSTMDAEYQACVAATREALSLHELLREVSMLCRVLWPGEATVILCDNKAAVSLCLDRKETKWA
jgi:hypothetical protein